MSQDAKLRPKGEMGVKVIRKAPQPPSQSNKQESMPGDPPRSLGILVLVLVLGVIALMWFLRGVIP